MQKFIKVFILIFCFVAISSANSSAFAVSLVNLHNNARAVYRIPKLTWSNTLAATSQIYANKLARTNSNLIHSKNRVLTGENLAYGTKGAFTPTKLFNLWLAEKKYFIRGRKFPNVSTTGSYKSVGHYTQIIWSTTKKVGCGMANSKTRTYLVCQYQGPGNYIGRYVF